MAAVNFITWIVRTDNAFAQTAQVLMLQKRATKACGKSVRQ